MDLEWYYIIFLVVFGFVIGIINTLAGGGSLITLPVLIFLGLPPNVANGTNRIPILVQSVVSIFGFRSKGLPLTSFSWKLALVALVGAAIGAHIAVDVNEKLFNTILAIMMLVVVVFMFLKPRRNLKDFEERLTGRHFWVSMVVFFFLGIYGGFLQAGCGIFILFALSAINNMSLVKGNLVKALCTVAFSISALIIFGLGDKLNWVIGIILAVGNALGAWFASRWSVGKGDRTIRWFVIVMILVMAFKLLFF